MRAAATPAARNQAARLSRVLAGVLLLVWANEVPTARVSPGGAPAVLGEKVTRCAAGDAARVEVRGAQQVAADNGPLTVTISDGRVAAVLAPPVKLTPGRDTSPRFLSLSLGAPRTTGGALAVTVAVRNHSDCAASLSVARAVARRPGRLQDVSQVSFGGGDSVVVPAGERITGLASMPLHGDGTYEITASTNVELHQVR